MTINGPWFIAEIAKDVPYGVAPMPVVSETGQTAAPLTSIEAGFVSAKVNTKARRRISCAIWPARVGPDSRYGGPAVCIGKTTWDRPEVQNDPVLSAFRPASAHCTQPHHPAMRAFWEPGEQALSGAASVEN